MKKSILIVLTLIILLGIVRIEAKASLLAFIGTVDATASLIKQMSGVDEKNHQELFHELQNISDSINDVSTSLNNIEDQLKEIRTGQNIEQQISFYIKSTSLSKRIADESKAYTDNRGNIIASLSHGFKDNFPSYLPKLLELSYDAAPVLKSSRGSTSFEYIAALNAIATSLALVDTSMSLIYVENLNEELWDKRLELAMKQIDISLESITSSGSSFTHNLLNAEKDYQYAWKKLLNHKDYSKIVGTAFKNTGTANICIETRHSTHENLYSEDTCIGSKESPVRITERKHRETGKTIAGGRVYGCVRYYHDKYTFTVEHTKMHERQLLGLIKPNSVTHERGVYGKSYPSLCKIQRDYYDGKEFEELVSSYNTEANSALTKTYILLSTEKSFELATATQKFIRKYLVQLHAKKKISIKSS